MKNYLTTPAAIRRWAWAMPVILAVVALLSLVAIALSCWALWRAHFHTALRTYGASGPIDSTYAQHAIHGDALNVRHMSMPNNLLHFIGATYVIACTGGGLHQITLDPGPLPTSWDGAHLTAACVDPTGVLQFLVLDATTIRIIASSSVQFS